MDLSCHTFKHQQISAARSTHLDTIFRGPQNIFSSLQCHETSGLFVLNLFTRPQTSICCLADTFYPQQLHTLQAGEFRWSTLLGLLPAVHIANVHLWVLWLVSKKVKFSCTLYGWQHADLCKRCGLWTSRLKCAALHNSITPTPPVQAIHETRHTGFPHTGIGKCRFMQLKDSAVWQGLQHICAVMNVNML